MLRKASPEFVRLYVLGIRPTMNYRTGLCGDVHGVAYSRLGKEVAYAPSPGSKRAAWSPSRDNVISLFDEGKRLGAIRMHTEQGRRELVFELLLADRDESVLRRTPIGRPHSDSHSSPTSETGCGGGFDGDYGVDDTHVNFENDAPISGFPVSDVGKSSGSGEDRSTRVQAATTTSVEIFDSKAEGGKMASREDVLRVALEKFRVMVHPSQLESGAGRQMLVEFSDNQILAAAERLHERNADDPGKTFNLTYFLRVMADVAVTARAAPLSRRSSARKSASGRGGMPWFLTASGIEGKARELGYQPQDGKPLAVWKYDVYRLAGVTKAEYRAAAIDFGLRV